MSQKNGNNEVNNVLKTIPYRPVVRSGAAPLIPKDQMLPKKKFTLFPEKKSSSPPPMKISPPQTFQHISHIEADTKNGTIKNLPKEWQTILHTTFISTEPIKPDINMNTGTKSFSSHNKIINDNENSAIFTDYNNDSTQKEKETQDRTTSSETKSYTSHSTDSSIIIRDEKNTPKLRTPKNKTKEEDLFTFKTISPKKMLPTAGMISKPSNFSHVEHINDSTIQKLCTITAGNGYLINVPQQKKIGLDDELITGIKNTKNSQQSKIPKMETTTIDSIEMEEIEKRKRIKPKLARENFEMSDIIFYLDSLSQNIRTLMISKVKHQKLGIRINSIESGADYKFVECDIETMTKNEKSKVEEKNNIIDDTKDKIIKNENNIINWKMPKEIPLITSIKQLQERYIKILQIYEIKGVTFYIALKKSNKTVVIAIMHGKIGIELTQNIENYTINESNKTNITEIDVENYIKKISTRERWIDLENLKSEKEYMQMNILHTAEPWIEEYVRKHDKRTNSYIQPSEIKSQEMYVFFSDNNAVYKVLSMFYIMFSSVSGQTWIEIDHDDFMSNIMGIDLNEILEDAEDRYVYSEIEIKKKNIESVINDNNSTENHNDIEITSKTVYTSQINAPSYAKKIMHTRATDKSIFTKLLAAASLGTPWKEVKNETIAALAENYIPPKNNIWDPNEKNVQILNQKSVKIDKNNKLIIKNKSKSPTYIDIIDEVKNYNKKDEVKNCCTNGSIAQQLQYYATLNKIKKGDMNRDEATKYLNVEQDSCVFGTPYEILLSKSHRSFPLFLEKAIDFLCKGGSIPGKRLEEEGILRSSPNMKQMETTIRILNTCEDYDFESFCKNDTNLVASIIKKYLSMLPQPKVEETVWVSLSAHIIRELKLDDLHKDLIAKGDLDTDNSLQDARAFEWAGLLCQNMSPPRLILLIRIFKFFYEITLRQELNKMSQENVANVIAPHMLKIFGKAPIKSPSQLYSNLIISTVNKVNTISIAGKSSESVQDINDQNFNDKTEATEFMQSIMDMKKPELQNLSQMEQLNKFQQFLNSKDNKQDLSKLLSIPPEMLKMFIKSQGIETKPPIKTEQNETINSSKTEIATHNTLKGQNQNLNVNNDTNNKENINNLLKVLPNQHQITPPKHLSQYENHVRTLKEIKVITKTPSEFNLTLTMMYTIVSLLNLWPRIEKILPETPPTCSPLTALQ